VADSVDAVTDAGADSPADSVEYLFRFSRRCRYSGKSVPDLLADAITDAVAVTDSVDAITD